MITDPSLLPFLSVTYVAIEMTAILLLLLNCATYKYTSNEAKINTKANLNSRHREREREREREGERENFILQGL